MKATILIVCILWSIFRLSTANAAGEICSKYCKPTVSKACGNACIPLANNCRKSWTTACNGERPASKAKDVFENPKHVDAPPK